MMQDDYIALLGTKGGPAIRPGSSMPTSNLVHLNGRSIVLDCGLGVTRGLVDQGMQLKDLSLVLISHLHSDHYLELGALLHTAWVAGLNAPVDVYGPKGLEDYWQAFLTSMKADIDLRIEDEGRPDLRDLVTLHVIDAGEVLRIDGITITAMRTEHPPLVDCFAFRFDTAHKSVVFSGDTAPMNAMEDFSRGADVLVHEAMLGAALPALMKRIGNGSEKLMEHWLRSHTYAHDAAKTARNAGVRHLVLSHLIPSDDPDYGEKDWQKAVEDHWSDNFTVGTDGCRISI
ncbi:MBL fold metallo-hydrolase [Yoonia sp. SS1-5]|uniref:MBL fold metallo-hydrolase n=1 Tax=Yoonia rhodophyticola TaxID=3137370 RepID=A0AAN0NLW5_9RHOB